MPDFPQSRPVVSRRFYRAHGLGNDYLVAEECAEEGEGQSGWVAGPGAVRAVCDRWQGVGSDGLVVISGSGPDAPFGLRMFNPDGSEFERSGNGLRIAASWLYREGRVAEGASFEVEVGGAVVRMEIHGPPRQGLYDISVDMGCAFTGPDAVDLSREALDPGGPSGAHGSLAVHETGPLPVHLVSVGNPHCVVFVDALTEGSSEIDCFSDASLVRMGPHLSGHPAFRNGTNVQLARVTSGQALELKIWERGVGRTLASGTSACAVAVAAVESERVRPGPLEMTMDGGRMTVTVGADLTVTLRGPVQEVCEGELSAVFVEGLPVG